METCRHGYFELTGPAGEVDYVCRECGKTASGMRQLWIGRLCWMLWLYRSGKLGGLTDGVEREAFVSRLRR